jgi:protein-disulfide isomerase
VARWLVLTAVLAAGCGGDATDRPAPPPAATGGAIAPAIPDPGYVRGDPAAPVTVIEFSDFGCAYCRQFAQSTFPELERRFIETGRVQWRYVAFVSGSFPNAEGAALAAECAAEQDAEAFWSMKDALYEAQRDWRTAGAGNAPFLAMAGRIGLDLERFEACLASDGARRRVQASNRMASIGSVTGTPTFYIEGRRALGALTAEQFGGLLESILAERAAPR